MIQPDGPQMTIYHGACALRADILSLQTRIQNM